MAENIPAKRLKTNRRLLKFLFFSLLTFGIYGLFTLAAVSSDINTIASRYDGKETMNYAIIAILFSWLSFGIVPLVWFYRLSDRVGDELKRRDMPYEFGIGDFFCWYVLGSLVFIGPWVYIHKLLKAMNYLAEDYNLNG